MNVICLFHSETSKQFAILVPTSEKLTFDHRMTLTQGHTTSTTAVSLEYTESKAKAEAKC